MYNYDNWQVLLSQSLMTIQGGGNVVGAVANVRRLCPTVLRECDQTSPQVILRCLYSFCRLLTEYEKRGLTKLTPFPRIEIPGIFPQSSTENGRPWLQADSKNHVTIMNTCMLTYTVRSQVPSPQF